MNLKLNASNDILSPANAILEKGESALALGNATIGRETAVPRN
jgi:hypothetical protein